MPVRCLVAVLLLLLPGAGTTARAAGPAASKVFFVSQRDAPGDFAGDIYALDPATGTIARLTRGEAIETDAPLAVSHDGSRVAYVTSDYVVRVVESDGSSTRSVAGCEYYAFSFSPDGRELACTESPGNEPVVATVDLDTGATQVLAPGTDPAWSPDGATIAFIDAKQHPAIVPATGGAARAVASPAVDNLAWPAVVWSPDSRRLAFVEGDVDVGPQTLWIVDAAGRVLHRLRGVGGVPAWSPDGATVAAVDRHTHQLVLVDATTGRKRQLTHERVSVSAPSWPPDGRRLAYLRARPLLRYSSDPEQDIVTIGRDGRGRRALTSPFPNGGATDRAIWTTGALVGGMRPPRVRVVPLHPTRETTLGDRASNVVADGPRAATVIDIGCVAVIWDERSGGRTSASSCSTQDVDTETMMDDTMSGPRFAWL